MTKISIIIPVYNAEKHLDMCVDSIVNQTYKNIEIILVNDGSSDNSGAVCDKWAKVDPRIKVIHKQNGGVSSARNSGLEVATGDYVGFVDSDDSVKPNWIYDLIEMNSGFNADLITFGVERISNSKITAVESMPSFKASGRDQLSAYFCRFFDDIFGSVCAKIYRTQIITDFNLRFDETLSLNEDAFFDYAFIPHATKILNSEN